MWGQALFSSGSIFGSIRDALVSDGCCLRHFTPSCSPQEWRRALHSIYPCRTQDENGPWGHWKWGCLPKGGGGSISIIEETQECFCSFCCPPCCRWGPEAALGFCCRLLKQAEASELPPDHAGSSKKETSKQRNKPTSYHSNLNLQLHCCSKQA